MTSFTSRYGNPAADYQGAHIRGHSRHGATVVTVSGRIDARNLGPISDYVARFVLSDTLFVLDLSGVTAFTPKPADLLDAVDERCEAAGVSWALVPGEVVTRRLGRRIQTLPVIDSVAEAEHQFDDAVLRRRRMLLPLLRKTA